MNGDEQMMSHPFHKAHALSLYSNPGNQLFRCDACGETGNGHSYRCGDQCNINLHVLCASKPLFITHKSHPHKLALSFSPPYPSESFCCEICQQIGSKQWLYRCGFCQFNAHLRCTVDPPPPIQTASRSPPQINQSASISGGTGNNQSPNLHSILQLLQQLPLSQARPQQQPSTTLHVQFPTGQNQNQNQSPDLYSIQQLLQQLSLSQTRPQQQPTTTLHAQFPTGQNQNPAGVVYVPVRPATTLIGEGNLLHQLFDSVLNSASHQLGVSLVQGLLPGGGHGHGHAGGYGHGHCHGHRYGDHSGHGHGYSDHGESTWDGGSSFLSNDYDDTGIDDGSIDFPDTDYY